MCFKWADLLASSVSPTLSWESVVVRSSLGLALDLSAQTAWSELYKAEAGTISMSGTVLKLQQDHDGDGDEDVDKIHLPVSQQHSCLYRPLATVKGNQRTRPVTASELPVHSSYSRRAGTLVPCDDAERLKQCLDRHVKTRAQQSATSRSISVIEGPSFRLSLNSHNGMGFYMGCTTARTTTLSIPPSGSRTCRRTLPYF
ncbi:hypothetical protein QBC45DRAFT_152034 [Copromyces sp. CBS 386.78]|nr:hypothetical protein QBC45DRAFT_152034 [Copromyces sp. CBS 386.78]